MSHSANKTSTYRNHAFTLIEMLVVVVIIGILAGVLIPRLVGAKERASDSGRMVKVWQISSAVELYAQEQGSKYPLAPLTGAPWISVATPIVTNAIAPYLTDIPTDPGKGTVAISTAPGNIMVTGDSFAYWTNDAWTGYAITALMESKKGNTTNGTGVIDSDKQWLYQKVGKGLTTNIVAGGGGGAPIVGVTQEWTDLVIYNGTDTYTIMDSNLWASIAGTGNTSYGYHFQRGNNYGFPISPSTIALNSTTPAPNTTSYGPSNPYNSSTWIWFFLDRNDWASQQNDNLRGNTTNTFIARKGPCPNGYHVPTWAERDWLIAARRDIYPGNDMNWTLLMNTLKLPMAGGRTYYEENSLFGQRTDGFYWSSSPNGWGSYGLLFSDSGISSDSYDRAYSASVRCFKN